MKTILIKAVEPRCVGWNVMHEASEQILAPTVLDLDWVSHPNDILANSHFILDDIILFG
jgi:hypothetical protein